MKHVILASVLAAGFAGHAFAATVHLDSFAYVESPHEQDDARNKQMYDTAVEGPL